MYIHVYICMFPTSITTATACEPLRVNLSVGLACGQSPY